MLLATLLEDLPGARVVGDPAVEVRGVVDDSREVGAGDVFVAVSRAADGHRFVGQAVDRGAAAVVVERPVEAAVPQVIVGDSAEAFGVLVSRALGHPARQLRLVGITGTNGKTTTSYLVEAILAAAARRPGVLGTVSYRYGGGEHPAPYTTPTPRILHETFAAMRDAGCLDVVLETSSAALAMDRLAGLRFRVGAFSNLTQDHLDVHGDMEAYRAAKARLFRDYLAEGGTAVINVDDPAAPHMIDVAAPHAVLRVSARGAEAEIRAVGARTTIDGIEATVETPRGPIEVRSRALLGAYNVANIALAVGIGEALGLPHEAIARGIGEMPGVPGRVERVANDQGLDILVDYAHTPDALANVLDEVRPLATRRLICVFGCGGDRDPTKRPRMGAAVAERADLAIVTSDNPRTEEPQSIIDMILPAVPAPFYVDVDRRTAIRAAVAEATPGDIVVIAGKGHEDYQILGTEKIHFDDREEAAAAAAARWSFGLDELARAAEGTVEARVAERFSRVIIDGRSAAPGDLYVAIRGERFDGHAFAAQAVAAGAAGLVVEAGAEVPGGVSVIRVADTRVALGRIARVASRRWTHGAPEKRLIGVTGSAGKTTTKGLIAAALAPAGRVHATAGSLNNETGVPLTLLGLRPFHDYAVIEMGMRGLGQIAYLVDLAEPHVGVVVNAGTAHVGVVGSLEDIARGKGEIFGELPSYGCAILPADDPRLAAHAARAPRRITFGTGADADVRVVQIAPAGAAGSDVTCEIEGRAVTFRLALPGRHNATNAACALAVAVALGVDPAVAARGLERARPAPMRGELREVAGRHVLVDCYNANPASMRAALETLVELRGDGRAVAIVGDMLELGDTAADEHRAVGALAASLGVPLIALGEHAGDVRDGAGGDAHLAADPAAAAALIRAHTRAGDWLLIKGSRGMRLERVLAALEGPA